MPLDLSFYMVAIPAVFLVGLAKGGLGDALALMGVPLLALVVSPVQAAAILLPILIVMDWISLWLWRQHGDTPTLKILLPGALFGIALGWGTAAFVPAFILRIVIGLITLLFCVRYFYRNFGARSQTFIAPQAHLPWRARLWGMLSGYGSFVAHSGGAPFQIYVLPLQLSPRDYTGTSVRFFAILNLVKLAAYFSLGQLDTENLMTSTVLLPIAPVATFMGAWCVRRMDPKVFYPFIYAMAFIAALLIIVQGVTG